VKTLVFVTGKFYYDITAERENNGRTDVAVVRIEQLFPLPVEQKAIIALYQMLMTMFGQKSLKTWSVQLYVDELQLSKMEISFIKTYSAPASGSYTRAKRHRCY
jgi:2-oxoglutarate dehydrogenase E1 component